MLSSSMVAHDYCTWRSWSDTQGCDLWLHSWGRQTSNVFRDGQYPINAHIWRQPQSIQNLLSDPSPYMLRDLGMVTLAVISNVKLVC